MRSQRELILDGGWENLIILDACRYDYFEKVYKDYLNGVLKKAISPGRATQEWLREIFGDNRFDDIVYVSANPHINSRGIEVEGFNAREHFYKVIDVWYQAWDSSLETVHPKEVNKAALVGMDVYRGKRFIIHYLQPHFPYITIGPLVGGMAADIRGGKKKDLKKQDLITKLRGSIGKLAEETRGEKTIYKIRRMIGLAQPGEVEAVALKYGVDGLWNAYEENLRIALEHVSRLLANLSGKIVISADHGNLLGENGLYGHLSWSNHPKLREIPWLEVEKES